MTQRQELVRHRHNLIEVREILNSMKTLAYMETRKLERYLDAQQEVVAAMEDVAADFLAHFPDTLPGSDENNVIVILIGSERGFCGDFNHGLLRHLDEALAANSLSQPRVVTVGYKLRSLLEQDQRVVACLDGAGVAEEVTSVIMEIVAKLSELRSRYGVCTLYCLSNRFDGGATMQRLSPPFQHISRNPPAAATPPLLNLEPEVFLLDLAEQFLFATLHELLYSSLMAENSGRVTHLDLAVSHLDDKSEDYRRRINALRQEEIIEEIEVILLSSADFESADTTGRR